MKIRVTTEGKSVAIDLEKKLGEKVFKAIVLQLLQAVWNGPGAAVGNTGEGAAARNTGADPTESKSERKARRFRRTI